MLLAKLSSALIALLTLFAGGCTTLADVTSGAIGCRASEIRVSNVERTYHARTWTARCNGRSFACSHFATGAGTSQVSCSPMGGDIARVSAPRTGSEARTRGVGSGRAERSYDEKRGVHVVRATFKVGPGIDLHAIGAPQVNLVTIAFVLEGRSYRQDLSKCPSVQVIVNEQPFDTEQNAIRDGEGSRVAIESRYPFQTFKPLAQEFATFGVRACQETFKLTEGQLDQLRKFLVIYSQVATQVQNGELPSKEGQELGSPQGEDVPASSDRPAAPLPRDGV